MGEETKREPKNIVHDMCIWKDAVSKELGVARDWEDTWGFMKGLTSSSTGWWDSLKDPNQNTKAKAMMLSIQKSSSSPSLRTAGQAFIRPKTGESSQSQDMMRPGTGMSRLGTGMSRPKTGELQGSCEAGQQTMRPLTGMMQPNLGEAGQQSQDSYGASQDMMRPGTGMLGPKTGEGNQQVRDLSLTPEKTRRMPGLGMPGRPAPDAPPQTKRSDGQRLQRSDRIAKVALTQSHVSKAVYQLS